MPFPFKSDKLNSTLSGSGAFWIIFGGCMLSIASVIAFVWSETSQRVGFYLPQSEAVQTRSNNNVSTQNIESSAEQSPRKNEKVTSLSADPTLLAQIDSKSSDPYRVLNEFDNWIAAFQKINCDITQNCLDHDPRKLNHFYQKGISLSRKRANVFEDLIKNDPELALERALPKDVIEKLPIKIRENLEVWEEGKGDILTHYGCKFTDHGACKSVNQLITAKDNLAAHLYGKQKNVQGILGGAYRGVRIGNHIALKEEPYENLESEEFGLSFAGQELSFKSKIEKDFFIEEIELSERRARLARTTVQYPSIAGSNGVTLFLESRYEVVSTPASWATAHADATARNGRLVSIGSASENAYILQLLSEANLGTSANAWIGLTDNVLQDGSTLNRETNTTETIQINASNGDWKWLSGEDVSAGFTNWENDVEPNTDAFSYASIQLSTGKWAEHNESALMPYIIEFDNGFEPRTNVAPIDGFRKVLVVPVRFRDEGHVYTGSNFPLVDNFGNPMFDFQQDSFEPISQEDLAKTMEEVREFFLRNSDGTFNLQPVITPTVTIDFDKYTQSRLVNDQDTWQFDSNRSLIGSLEVYYSSTDILGSHGPNALYKVARKSREWDYDGPAFEGILSVGINGANNVIEGNFTAPPEITFSGGNIDPATGLPDPDFEPAKAEAILNSRGELSRIKILDSGSFYHTTPTILLDGNNSFNAQLTVNRGRVVVTWLIVSTFYDPSGTVGWGSLPGVGSWAKVPMPNPWYPQIDGGNGLSFGVTIAHEFGHNFSLQHANLYESFSEKPNSDEGRIVGYSNPYSIMGNRAPLDSGDLTVPAKVNMNWVRGFGLTHGTQQGVDVASLLSPAAIQASNLKEQNQSSIALENTFRIYRHDYGHGPYTLRTGEYHLRFPQTSDLDNWLSNQNFRQELLIGGPGDGASGLLDMTNTSPRLIITEGGKGYAEEPEIQIIDENNQTLLRIDPTWIQLRAGTDESSYKQAHLRDFSLGSHRGLRGMELTASQFAPIDSPFFGNTFSGYWLSYRRSASEYGLTVINGHQYQQLDLFGNQIGSIQHNLLDMTMDTPHDFSDCFLMLGHTFSDYESDVHITPIRKGGIPPMEFIEVVVNMGTSATSNVPPFSLNTTTQTPKVGQEVEISVDFSSANATDYSYGWYTNEVMETDPESLAGIRYEWVNQRLSYFEATAYANARGGHLACVESQDELDEIFSLVNKNLGLSGTPDYVGDTVTTGTAFIWLGGSDSEQEGVWKWQNGEPFTFTKWGSVGFGEPDNFIDPVLVSLGGQDGLALALTDFPQGRQGEWNDLRLAEKLTFVIEYPSGKRTVQGSRQVLNKPGIVKKFDKPGYHVVKVKVSDMRGAVSSRNLVFQVGDYQLENTSPVSGIVRSGNGYVQGARVTFSQAQVVEHFVSMSGNERDWFLPDGGNDPLTYNIDGQKAPDLVLRRGEVHRFYFDDKAANFGLTFFDQPESEAPRVKINMLVTPMVDSFGDGYSEMPEINSTETGLFSSYLSHNVGTIKDYQNLEAQGVSLGSQTKQFLVTRPYAKVLLSDTNITGVRVRPTETDDFGNFIAFGGQGHDRTNAPVATIRRTSLWEDYTDDNASVNVYVDGVGTLSPVNTTSGFLSPIWRKRGGGDPIPNVVVWGTGSEFNATVESRTINRQPHHEIVIIDQGKEFEPNATMGMLHWPIEPFAMWTFDRHETLYDNDSNARYKPSPAWNKPIRPADIIHYWSFDEENGTIIADRPTSGNGAVPIVLTADLSDINRSTWGVKGRALRLKSTDNDVTVTGVIPQYPFTFSTWLLLDTNVTGVPSPTILTFDTPGISTTINGGDLKRNFAFGAGGNGIRTTTVADRNWGHLGMVAVDDTNFTLYIDGFPTTTNSARVNDLTIHGFDGLIDEMYIYKDVLSATEVKALAGREYLDLSGNKHHIVPIGDDFTMASPAMTGNLNGSDTDVPIPNNLPANRPGRLGDSFAGENHGRSVSLTGNDYLDLSTNLSDFATVNEGTICFWIKTSDVESPILSASKSDDNDTYFQLTVNSNGFPEVVLMADGNEAAKYFTTTAVNDSAWHHVALQISETSQSFWVDGQQKGSQGYAGGSGPQRALFADVEKMDFLAIGKHVDSNVTSFLTGNIDDFYVFDRILTQAEISFLYNLQQGREQVPRLEAVVDAVGSIKLIDNGDGYKEQPEAFFSYGGDGNLTEDLIDAGNSVPTAAGLDHTLDASFHGNILYVEDEDRVYSYHFSRPDGDTTWRRDGNNSAWRPYQLAVGVPEMNATSIEQILWTKKMDTLTEFSLPDDRNITRNFLEYVEHEGGTYIPTKGLFGYTTPPVIDIQSSPTDENATGYALFFIDENTSTEIVNPGLGLTANSFTNNEVRISGRGFRPSQADRMYFKDDFGNMGSTNVQIHGEEEPGQNAAELTAAGNTEFRVTVKLNLAFNFTVETTYTLNDTVVGLNTSRFLSQLRVGDFVQLVAGGANVGNSPNPNFIITEVLSDQRFIVADAIQDFTGNGAFDLGATSYHAIVNETGGTALTIGALQGDFFNPPSELHIYQPRNSNYNPFSSEYIFNDWNSNGARTNTGEPRNNDALTDFNQTISDVMVQNVGYGYSVPVEVNALGGFPSQATLQAWVDTNNTFPMFKHATLQIESNGSDVNGSILETNSSIRVIDGGYGYADPNPGIFGTYTRPSIAITGGGGTGAQAIATMGEQIIIPFGSTLVSVGIINPDLVDVNGIASLSIEQNNTLVAGTITIDANETTDLISIGYNTSTVSDLIIALNATPQVFNQISPITGNASLMQGSLAQPLTDINVTSLNSISMVTVSAGGHGYYNLDPANIPTARMDFNASGQERNASLEVRLGGSVAQIPECTTCNASIDPDEPTGYRLTDSHEHTGAWIEIWDQGRNERNITQRALAVPKVRNGKIEKIVVVESGSGYVDPVVKVRGIAPRHGYYNDGVNRADHYESRIWMCSNLRETRGGELVKCGHIERGMYPPEDCPGEVDIGFPVGAAVGANTIQQWQQRHDNRQDAAGTFHSCNNGLVDVTLMDGSTTNLDYSAETSTHYNVGFKTRVCGGSKVNFVLLNDPYRHPYEDWEMWDASLSVVTQQGKISEVVVRYGGEMYINEELAITGTGSGVDAIPVIREDGYNTMIILDDPDLKNIELVPIQNPRGGGMGFSERPWSWDANFPAIFGPTEQAVLQIASLDDIGLGTDFPNWNYGTPTMGSFSFGDQIREIIVRDYGLYDGTRPTQSSVTIDFNSSTSPVFDEANITASMAFRMTRIGLDQNATYLDMNPQNNADAWRTRSLYQEQPVLNIIDFDGNSINMVGENVSEFIRGNGNGNYLSSGKGKYFDLYVDDRFPNNFYYGFGKGATHLPAMGGSITVVDPIPGLTWGANEPVERNMTVYTDQNGYYMIPDLEPGMYNVAVFMEDENFQESTFRPEGFPNLVSQTLYVPGMPELTLESDNFGYGKSKLIWSAQSRDHSRFSGMMTAFQEEATERKILEGIGAGFQNGESPELVIIPGPENSSFARPNIQATGLIDGSLRLQIIDDLNTSSYNPGDKFTVFFSSSVSGVNFVEDYVHSLSSQTSWAGSTDSHRAGMSRIQISPNDGNGTNFVEIPLRTISNLGSADANVSFTVQEYNASGLVANANLANVQWRIVFDFNDSLETDYSRLASLDVTTGANVTLNLHSTMRTGRVLDFEVLNTGNNYLTGSSVKLDGSGRGFLGTIQAEPTDGNITGVTIENRGVGYDGTEPIIIEDINGTGAVLKALMGGQFYLEANFTNADGELLQDRVRLMASRRNLLSDQEAWLDLYLDNFSTPVGGWWALDSDGDTITNLGEYQLGTNPLVADTDGDGLSDSIETVEGTNPLITDTDGDGLSDSNETIEGTNPLLVDSDGDGFSDYEELANPLLNPTQVDQIVSVSGVLYSKAIYPGDVYIRIERGSVDISGNPQKFYGNNEPYILVPNSFPQTYPHFKDLVAGLYYRVSGFIDSNGNGQFEPGEIYSEWEELVTQNQLDAHLYFEDLPPVLDFFDGFGENIEVVRGESFKIAVRAFDYPDDNWTGPLLINAPFTNRSISVSGTALNILQIDTITQMATVSPTGSFGDYDLVFVAKDTTGTDSVPSVRTITVTDKSDPVITVNFTPYLWPSGTTWDNKALSNGGAFSAMDAPDQNLTNRVLISGIVDYQTIGEYVLSLSVTDDFGRTTTVPLTVKVEDQIAPVFEYSTGYKVINWLVGTSFGVPPGYILANDNVDGNLTSSINYINLDLIDENQEGNQTLQIEVSDLAGNISTDEVTISFEYPSISLAGVAIDGYLNGASVVFRPSSPLMSDNLFYGATEVDGGFSIPFLASEFELMDLNQNGLLDPEEGMIEISGGIDSVTNRTFNATLKADAGATVVTPLTTVIAEMMELGSSKEAAKSQLTSSLGLPSGIDVTTYDPIESAGNGDTEAALVLQSGAVVANILKQTEQLFETLDADLSGNNISLSVARNLGSLLSQGNISLADLENKEFLKKLTVDSITSAAPNVEIDANQLDDFSEILTTSNKILKDDTLLSLNSQQMLKTLAQRQIAIEEEVITSMEKVASGEETFNEIKNSTTESLLLTVAELQVGVNQFVPRGISLDTTIIYTEYESGDVIAKIDVSDGDGDPVTASIVEGNQDRDGDTNKPFSLDSSYQIKLEDMDDIKQLAGQTITLKIKLDDNGDDLGTHGELTAKIKLSHSGNTANSNSSGTDSSEQPRQEGSTPAETDYSILEATLNSETGWYDSPWFGTFYAGANGWIFHQKLGWLYLHPTSTDGFWCWDPTYNSWWWSYKQDEGDSEFFYFYLQTNAPENSGWGGLDLSSEQSRIYEFFKSAWIIR